MPLFNWTGNPWVDTGLAVAIVKANKKTPEEMTIEDFKGVISNGEWLVHANEHLNSYICLFANAFLNRQVKPKDKPSQRVKYRRIIKALVADLEKSISVPVDSTNLCECTGLFPSANKTIALLTEEFRKEKILKKDQRLDIGRNAFPLIGSITNDAGALPAASREPQLSAFALLCAQIAPLAAVMLKGKIAFFQYTEPNLLVPHVRSIYNESINKLSLIHDQNSSIAAIGTGKGSQSIAFILLDQFHRLKNSLEIKELPEYVAINLWLVINSGTSFDCEIVEIPNSSLKFLWEAGTRFPDEIKGFLKKEKSKSILDCIENGKDYMPFYPFQKSRPIPINLSNRAKTLLSTENRIRAESIEQKENAQLDDLKQAQIVTGEAKENKKTKKSEAKEKAKKESPKTILQLLNDEYKQNKRGEIKEVIKQINEVISKPASKELFGLYQTTVVGHTAMALSVAEWIAYNLRERLKDKKERKQFELFVQYLGDFKDVKKCKPLIRQLLGEFAESGILTYEQYVALFPIIGNKPLRVNSFGWRYIWFYLNHKELNVNSPDFIEEDSMSIKNDFRKTIKRFAKDVFDWYVSKHGEDKFKRVVLNGFSNNKIKDADLQRWFCNLAEIPGKADYTNEAWDELCRDENGTNRTYELRFQLRLELANLYRRQISK